MVGDKCLKTHNIEKNSTGKKQESTTERVMVRTGRDKNSTTKTQKSTAETQRFEIICSWVFLVCSIAFLRVLCASVVNACRQRTQRWI
jgi:hypothetical protein